MKNAAQRVIPANGLQLPLIFALHNVRCCGIPVIRVPARKCPLSEKADIPVMPRHV
jgi:hypothetical protein